MWTYHIPSKCSWDKLNAVEVTGGGGGREGGSSGTRKRLKLKKG